MLTLLIVAGLLVVARKPPATPPATETPPADATTGELRTKQYVVSLVTGERTEEAFVALFAAQGVQGKFLQDYGGGLVLIELTDSNIAAAFERLGSSLLVSYIMSLELFISEAKHNRPTITENPTNKPQLGMPGTTMGG